MLLNIKKHYFKYFLLVFNVVESLYCILKIGLARLGKFFAKLKFSSALFEKIPSFACLVFKIENKWILILQNLFS